MGAARHFLAGLVLAAACAASCGASDAALVAIDVGHTRAEPGATSARGRGEFEFNRELAADLAGALTARGLRVRLVNAAGEVARLEERARLAAGADLLVSIHHDSVSEGELRRWIVDGREQGFSDRWAGHSLFVSRDNPEAARSLLCARAIGARLQRLGFAPTDKNAARREWADAALAVHYYDNLVVLYRSTLPALLFEAGVIRHRAEELALRDPQRRARMADGMATGIAACLAVPPPGVE